MVMKTRPENFWFNIFRTGTHTASNGTTASYTKDDLQRIIDRHNADDPAPLVVGHPKHHAPAYGWVSELRVKGDILQARAKDVHDDFAQMVREGRFKKISIALLDGALQHIGFLGAAAPAVKGLGTVNWSEARTGQIFEFALENSTNEDTMAENTEITPDEQKSGDFAKQEQALKKREAELAVREKKIVEAEAAQDFAQQQQNRISVLEKRAADAEFAAFEQKLISKGIVNPLGSELTRKIIDLADERRDFAEGEAEAVAQELQAVLLKLPKRVDFGEQSKADQSDQSDFTAGNALQQKAREYQENNPGVSWPDAVTAVTN